jgi:predicted TIM-barrel fold metal-dependent hydrolase
MSGDLGTVIDFRARLAPGPVALERQLRAMDAAGIDRAVLSAGGILDPDTLVRQILEGGYTTADADNDAVIAACAKFPERLVPAFFANPHRGPEDYRDRAGSFRGLELSPAVHGLALTDDRNLALVQAAQEAGHAVYVVCIGRAGATPRDLVVLAAMFPGVVFVLGHCGFVGIDFPALRTVAPLTNVVAETSGCYTAVARAAVERLGEDRVLFGTEMPMQDPAVELAKMRALDLDPAAWSRVMWRNAERLIPSGLRRLRPAGAPSRDRTPT